MFNKKLKRLSLVTCYLSLITFSVSINAEDGAARNTLESFLKGLQTFSADFEQTLFNEFGEELEISSGTVFLAQPGKFHWAYETPYSQYLVSNGKSLWIYDEDLEQVTISDMGDAVEKSPASILSGDVELEDNYLVNELGSDGENTWLEITPEDVNSQYNAIRLGFNEQELSGMVLFDNLGQSTRILFTSTSRNTELDSALFNFEPPEGVDIIDSREQ